MEVMGNGKLKIVIGKAELNAELNIKQIKYIFIYLFCIFIYFSCVLIFVKVSQ